MGNLTTLIPGLYLLAYAALWLVVARRRQRRANDADDVRAKQAIGASAAAGDEEDDDDNAIAAAGGARTMRKPLLEGQHGGDGDGDDARTPAAPALRKGYTFSRLDGRDPDEGAAPARRAPPVWIKSRVPLAARQSLYYLQAAFHATRLASIVALRGVERGDAA